MSASSFVSTNLSWMAADLNALTGEWTSIHACPAWRLSLRVFELTWSKDV